MHMEIQGQICVLIYAFFSKLSNLTEHVKSAGLIFVFAFCARQIYSKALHDFLP